MDFERVAALMKKLAEQDIPKTVLENFEQTFEIEYTHHSTAMEGKEILLHRARLR